MPALSICTYTIELLPNVEENIFETRMLQEILPQMMVSRRTIRKLELEYYLFKDQDNKCTRKYQWQIWVLGFDMFSREVDYSFAFKAIDEDVNRKLDGLGRPVASTIHHEIGRASVN